MSHFKPIDEKKAEGTYRADRDPANGPKSTPIEGDYPAPDWMDARAQDKWKKLIPVLQQMGVFTDADVDVVAMYCVAYSRWATAEECLRKEGSMVMKQAGKVKRQSPYVAISQRAREELKRLGSELGLSPNARTKIRVKPPRKKDKLDALLG